jgi:hypothetical protein
VQLELICKTCGGKDFIRRACGSSPKNQEEWEDFECKKCREWIVVKYTAKWMVYNKKKKSKVKK